MSWNNKFQTFEAADDDAKIDGDIREKIVVLGLTIEGVGGIIATRIGEKWTGEVQAQTLQTMIDGTSISRSSEARLLEVGMLTLLLLLLLSIVPGLPVMMTVSVLSSFRCGIIIWFLLLI
jgi:CHASE2 domain-containing sensor protein